MTNHRGNHLSHLDAEILLYEGESEVDTGGDARARRVLAVPDVDRIGVDHERRESGRQLLRTRQWVVTRRPSSSPASAATTRRCTP